ncbi:MAG: polyprenyl synthetase family protein [Gemmataceae bacterium]|nr:polyprenyl synthetase family protein [Gemmataceae bacterium]MCI0742955.1 polyprenyl synthetase family protein [Gemmataceae bacterium]
MTFKLTDYLQSQQSLVERRLSEVLAKEIGIPAQLRQAMEYSLLAPGKRLRPALVFLSCESSGGTDEQAWPAACAVEMIHTYSLIHDDLPAMDDDDLRRGLPTCHKKFGEALAILAGDALLTLAFGVLAEYCPAKTAANCCAIVAQASGAGGMVGGQFEDMAWEDNVAGALRVPFGADGTRSVPTTLAEALEHIHSQKTGALFRACLKLGVWAAQGENPGGPDADLIERLDRYGHCFGLVFQITDDLLDVESNADQLGKRTQKDAARGKLTYPGLLGIPQSRQRAQDLTDEALAAIAPLGVRREGLAALMQFCLARNR